MSSGASASESEGSPAPPTPVAHNNPESSSDRRAFFCACCQKNQTKIAKPHQCTNNTNGGCDIRVCTTCKRHCYGNPDAFECFDCAGNDMGPPCKKQVIAAAAPKRRKNIVKSVNGAPAAAEPDWPKDAIRMPESVMALASGEAKAVAVLHAIAAIATWGAGELTSPSRSLPAE